MSLSSSGVESSPFLSPELRSAERRSRLIKETNERNRERLYPWCIALFAASIEVFLFKSSLCIWVFGRWFGTQPSLYLSYGIFTLCLASLLTLIARAIGPAIQLGWPSGASAEKSALGNSSFADLNTSRMSRHSNLEWVEQHSFGPHSTNVFQTPSPGKSRIAGDESYLSVQSAHSALGAFDTSSLHLSASVSPASAVFPKSAQSIHTQEQLERMLRKDKEARSKYGTTSHSPLNTSLYGRYLFDSGDGKGYQLSAETEEAEKDGSPYRITRTRNGRVVTKYFGDGDEEELAHLRSTMMHLKQSPKKSPSLRRADSIERRRRSHSSPDGQISPASASSPEIDNASLTEKDWLRGEHRMRVWLVNTVLCPLTQSIAKLNKLLEQEHLTPSLRIGVSSVDTLKLALHERPKLRSTALPFIIPYLSVHINQAYLVQRIGELALNPFMRDYKWNSGGTEPIDEKTWSGRAARRAWTDALPTDAVLVFDLFSAYMDSQLASCPIVGTARVDQPFTSRYTLKAPAKPNAIHQAAQSFYLHMVTATPPHFELAWSDADGSTCSRTLPLAKGASNLFRVLVQFVRHAKAHANGHLDNLSLGPAGVNLLCVLN